MNHARIIKLDSPLTVVSSSFEEAFGEYSNMSAKRLARIKARNARKREARAARKETKIAKQQDRAEIKTARLEKRRAIQQARVAKRRQAMEERQNLRDERKKRRLNRKRIDEEEEGGGAEQGGAGEENEESGAGEEGRAGEERGAGEEGGNEEEVGGEESGDGEEESEADGYYDSFASADGINYEDLGITDDLIALVPDDYYTYESGAANPDGEIGIVKQKISPEIKSIAQKSEWNKEMVLQLNNKVAAINNTLDKGVSSDQAIQLGKTRADLISKSELSKDRAVQFDGMMSDYVNFDANTMDYSGDNVMSYANGKKKGSASIKIAKRKRLAEVNAAKREAMKLRKKMILNKIKKNKIKTKVAKSLKPLFDTQKITIPAADLTTGANGETGLIAIDDINNYDAPLESTFTFSNASGKSAKKWGGIILGVLVIGAAIWYGKKKKLF